MSAGYGDEALVISSLKYKGVKLELRQENITKCRVEAIVNPTNSKLFFGAGVSAKLLAIGGNEVFRATRELAQRSGILQHGACVNSTAGNLPCRHLLHTVTPVWSDGNSGEEETLAAAIKSVISLASHLKVESIAVPMLSAGNHPYPKETVARIMLREIQANINIREEYSLKLVRFAMEDPSSLKEMQEEMENVKFMQQYEMQDEEPDTNLPEVGSWIKEQRIPTKPKAVQQPQQQREVKATPPQAPAQQKKPEPAVVPAAETDAIIMNLVDKKEKVPSLPLVQPGAPPKTSDFIDADTSGRKKDNKPPKSNNQKKCCSIF